MNRTMFTVAAVFSASSLLLVDSAVKGTVLLALAAVVALFLRRDSAATRHLVWLLAIVAMLVVPLLSAMLPQWRVLPAWASHSPEPVVVDVSPPSIARPAEVAVEFPQASAPVEVERPISMTERPAAPMPESQVAIATPKSNSESMAWSWNWITALPLVWAIGFCVLILRLSAARWLLWNSERRATVVCRRVAPQLAFESRSDSATANDSIVTAMDTICSQLGISRRVTLLIHPDKTIPVVWGILRCRLMLPAAARQWSDEQLRSVLLHELAHIKRRDTIVQLLAQVACALHWFNPLVWFAAWRLDVERERSCDDLVLASGVRPSAYAGHLLEVVTGLSPARWTQSCGLAMARQSSLEGRLTAVLGKDLNRRSVSVALAGLALVIAIGVAVPIAMLRAADEKQNPPQEREDVALTTNLTGKLAPETVAKLKWGEPVNGLRMALAYPPALGDALLGKKPHFELVVQNVTKKEIHFLASDEAPNPRRMLIRQGERIELGLRDHLKVSPADWKLLPGEFGVLRLFATEESNKAGTVPSSAIESDLSKLGRYHAIVEMEIANAPPGAWTGKLVTGPTRGSADVADAPAPKHKDARSLYEIWQRHARGNGDIPGALVGELAAAVRQFIKYNPTWETVPKLNELLPRLDATHDWKPADAIALLDEVAAIKDSPLSMAMRRGTSHTIRQGETLPKKFADARWGEAQPNGLRAAWVLEPSVAEHRIGSAMKARLLVQNAGKIPVMVQVPTFHQGGVKGTDAKGADVEVSGIEWLTLAALEPVRLAPGEYIEISTPGVGLGPRTGMGPWAGPGVGSNVLAKPGDELTLTHGLVPLDGSEVGMSEDDPRVVGPGWWLAHIKARLNCELPLPADAAERTRLLDRAVRELFATAPSAKETAEFVADKTPDALDALAKRLAARADVVSFSGKLPTAPAKFRVLAADPNADKQPRVALGPGEYPLPSASAERGDAKLKIVGRPVGDRRTNDAQLLFEPVEFTGIVAPDPHKLEVPDGWGTWAIVCRPSDGFLYLLHKGRVRKIDYSKPREVTDTPTNDLPAEFRDEVKRQLEIAGVSDAQQAEMFEKPAAPATSVRSDEQEKPKTAATESPPKTTVKEPFTAWGQEVGGLQAGLGFKAGEMRAYTHGETVTLVVRVRNVGQKEIKFQYYPKFLSENSPTVLDETGKRVSLRGNMLHLVKRDIPKEVNLAVGKEIELYERELRLAKGNEDAGELKTRDIFPTGKFLIQHEQVIGNSAQASEKLDPGLEKLATGKLELEIKPVAPVPQDAPKPDAAQGGLRADVKPDSKHLFNKEYSAFAVQSAKDVNFVLIYQGFLSTGITETWSSASSRWTFEGNVHLVDREKTKAAGKNVDKRVIAVKYTSDAPTTLFLDGKAYDLAAQPRMTSMGALEAAPGRVFLLRDEGEPFQTPRTLALRTEQDLATIGNFAVSDRVNAESFADNRRIQEMEGWVLAFDVQVPHRRSGGHRFARLRIFPDGRVLSSPNGRVLRELKITAGELSELLRWLAEDQKVPVVKAQAAQPGDPKPTIDQQFDTWAGGVSFLQFKHNDLLHSITVGSHLRKPGTGKELANPGAAAFEAIRERLAELENKAATAPAKPGADAAKPASKPPRANIVNVPDDQ